jgi:hypothetical protein
MKDNPEDLARIETGGGFVIAQISLLPTIRSS